MPAKREEVQELIDGLRERIRRIERRPPRSDRVVASGWPEVDGLLGGGFPRGALAELTGGRGSGKTALALSALAKATAEGALAAYVDGRGELYAPAAAALGVDLSRLLIVRPSAGASRRETRAPFALSPSRRERTPGDPGQDALWAAEALLASGAFAVVAVDVSLPPGARARSGASAEAMARRLQGAAEKGGAAGLWLAEPGGCRVPAAVRLEVEAGERGPVVRRQGGGTARAREPGASGALAVVHAA